MSKLENQINKYKNLFTEIDAKSNHQYGQRMFEIESAIANETDPTIKEKLQKFKIYVVGRARYYPQVSAWRGDPMDWLG